MYYSKFWEKYKKDFDDILVSKKIQNLSCNWLHILYRVIMKIAVAGTGYVGLSLATLLSVKNEVVALDVIPEK